MSSDWVTLKIDDIATVDSIKIHPGKNAEATLHLVRHVFEYRDNFSSNMRLGGGDRSAVTPDADTNCMVLFQPNKGTGYFDSIGGIRLFDLACAYTSDTLVGAMMQHPDTPVGASSDLLSGTHSALTFLASTIVDEAERNHRSIDSNVTSMRTGVFALLIADPRTDVDHRTLGGDSQNRNDVLGILGRNQNIRGLAYYLTVSRLLQLRQEVIAASWAHKDILFEAFHAANQQLAGDPAIRRMSAKDSEAFIAALDADIDNQFRRTAIGAYGQISQLLEPQRNRFRDLGNNLDALSSEEVEKARIAIGRAIWTDCANLACLKARLVDMRGEVEPMLPLIANKIDESISRPTHR